MIDFSNYEVDIKSYSGSDDKRNIMYNDKLYMIKIPNHEETKNSLQTSVSNNVISEYIGCHIMQSLGLDTQNTLLGMWKNEIVVACEDFCPQGYELHEFSWYMQNVMPKSKIGRIPTYEQLYHTFNECSFLQPVRQAAIERYWDTIIGDALRGNFDRHKDIFGFLTNGKDIKLAPIYDCGASLYPKLSEEKYSLILNNDEEIKKRVYEFPKIALNKNNSKSTEDRFKYHELLSSGFDKECSNALLRIYPKIDISKIDSIVENTPYISDERINFYKTMIRHRKEMILDYSYNKIVSLNKNADSMSFYSNTTSDELLDLVGQDRGKHI